MDLSFFQVTLLALIQGMTEFLPVSSSAHLILPSLLLDWTDQGLTFDVAVHLGSLFAVLAYFRHDILQLLVAWLRHLTQRQTSEDSRLAWLIIIATVPGALAGLLANDLVENYARSGYVIGSTSMLFALLLWYADKRVGTGRSLSELTWRQALFVGFAQVLALIPGTSRSGITMTAALFCGLTRQAAAKLSFFLAIPIIFGSFTLRGTELVNAGELGGYLLPLAYGVFVSGLVAFACIHYFMQLIERIGFLPFVIYRIGLAVVLFAITFMA